MTTKKLKPYKQQLLDLLIGSGWELLVIDEERDWWFDEHWTIRSVRDSRGYEIVISFIVEPAFQGLQAATRRPRDHLDGEAVFASMPMSKGLYNQNLAAFVREINDHRDRLDLDGGDV